MDYIIKNGISSKNTTLNTEKSISLAFNNPELLGVSLNLYMTKDDYIVVSDTDIVNPSSNQKIRDFTLEELRRHNIGTRVNREEVMTLESVLRDFHGSEKVFIFTMNDMSVDNQQFVETVASIVNRYPNSNLYIKSPSKEIVLYLRDLIQFASIGAVLLNEDTYFLKQNLDFYCLSGPKLCPYWSKQKKEAGILLMVESIVNEKDAVSTIHDVQSFLNKMYMIVDDNNVFKTIYPVCQKELETLKEVD